MHTPIRAVQLDVSVTTQSNILLSLTYNYNKTTKISLKKTISCCQLTEAQCTSQLLQIKIMLSSAQGATFTDYELSHHTFFWNIG